MNEIQCRMSAAHNLRVSASCGEDQGGLNQDSKASSMAHAGRMATALVQVQDPPVFT
jgi:hypothetical protein